MKKHDLPPSKSKLVVSKTFDKFNILKQSTLKIKQYQNKKTLIQYFLGSISLDLEKASSSLFFQGCTNTTADCIIARTLLLIMPIHYGLPYWLYLNPGVLFFKTGF